MLMVYSRFAFFESELAVMVENLILKTRRPAGQVYLKNTLASVLAIIINDQLILEIDPNKVSVHNLLRLLYSRSNLGARFNE